MQVQNFRIWFLVAGLIIFFPQSITAQQATATLAGTVTDETGGVLPGVELTLINLETSATRSGISGDTGGYRLSNIAPGEYELRAQLPGFQTAVRSGISLNVGRQASLDITLSVGAVTEEVIVTGDAPLVDTLSSSLRELVDDRKIRDLPLNGRSFDQLALLQAGVVAHRMSDTNASASTAGGARFSVGGARPTANTFILDGTNINDAQQSTPGSAGGVNLGVEAIREFEILTNNYDATFGRSAGAVLNVVTKSGTNELHGSLFYFHRNDNMDARNFFDAGDSPPEFKRNQFGFSLGGPVVKDKVFLFGNYEALRERLGLTNIAFVPTADGRQGIGAGTGGSDIEVNPAVVPYLNLYPLSNGREFGDGTGEFFSSPSQPIDENYLSIRYDHQVSDADSFFVRYTFQDGTLTIPDRLLLFPEIIETRRQYVTIEHKHIFSTSALNTARFGLNRSVRNQNDDLTSGGVPTSLSLIPGNERLGLFNFSTQVVGGPASITNLGPGGFGYIIWNSFQFADDFSYNSGRNSIRVGVNIERGQFNGTNAAFDGARYSINTFRDFLQGKTRIFQSYIPEGNFWRGMRTTIISAYVQDEFQWTKNFTLNLGLRYESMTTPSEVNNLQAQLTNPLDSAVKLGAPYFEHPGHMIEPRIGLAWDLFGDGRTSLRGGYGIFNDLLLGGYWVNAIANIPPLNGVATIGGPAKDAIFPNAFSLVTPAGANSMIRSVSDPSLPVRHQWNLSLQHEVLPNTVFGVVYAGAVGRHEVRNGEANTALPTAIVNGQKCWGPDLCPARGGRRNPNFGFLLTTSTDGNSSYNSLQLNLRRRFSQGLQFQSTYTWGHAIDDGSQQWGTEGSNNPQNAMDFNDRKRDRGVAIFDITHNFTFNASYELPFGRDLAGIGRHVAEGWQINSIVTLGSGPPGTVITGFNRANNIEIRNPDRPDLRPGASNNPTEGTSEGCAERGGPLPGTALGTPDLWFDPCVFNLPPQGIFGDLGRTTMRGPGFAQWDFGLFKNFDVSEDVNLQFRAEFFNILNRANFSVPQNAIFETGAAATAIQEVRGSVGRITQTVSTSREIQLALKLVF